VVVVVVVVVVCESGGKRSVMVWAMGLGADGVLAVVCNSGRVVARAKGRDAPKSCRAPTPEMRHLSAFGDSYFNT
jgi:hypothetical protein